MKNRDFRHILRDEYEARLARNAAYSSRAMARDMGVSAAYFSQIMTGKRNLNVERAVTIGKNLGWSDIRIRGFVQSVQKSLVRDDTSRKILDDTALPEHHRLDSDSFKLIAHWYHYAILELTTVKDFKSNVKWIAHRLGISVTDARTGVERLFKLGLLEDVGGRWQKTVAQCDAGGIPSAAIRYFHSQMQDKAKLALANQGFDEREFVGVTLAINPEKINEAKAMIEKFFLEFMGMMTTDHAKAVYQLNVGLFRLDETAPLEGLGP